ncbi:unnamed protein product [Heligmosomoides polygyrus]|uniref:Uncharacterized protein n=1 Tax=Heligmosomoides polygyrus TaxID=6339 RepID=A0A3P7XJI8_HELPZ|nr:unnamed protein product [Heligmosomoides polygyrus]
MLLLLLLLRQNLPKTLVKEWHRTALERCLIKMLFIEDLSRLAMFGKQRTVLRRSQIREPPPAAAPSPVVSAQSKRDTPSRPGHPTSGGTVTAPLVRRNEAVASVRTRLTPTCVRERNTQFRIAGRTEVNRAGPARVNPGAEGVANQTAQAQEREGAVARQANKPVAGPITRARSKELESRTAPKHTQQTRGAVGSSTNVISSIASGVAQLRVGTERLARDRAPRTNTSSTSASLRANPVRVAPRTDAATGELLSGAPIPSQTEFCRELHKRVSSLGPTDRGTSSTPKEHDLAPSGTSARNGQSDARRHLPLAAAAGGSSVTRPNLARPPTSVRSSSVTRPAPRPSTATRASSVPRAPSVTHSASSNLPRAPSVTRPRAPSVTRPVIPEPLTSHRATPRTCAPQCASRVVPARAPVTSSGIAASSARGTPSLSSVRRSGNLPPAGPRASVIRITPAKRGAGDGTPSRGFRSDLRRYPAPTATSTCTTAGSPRTLTADEQRAMVNRLAVPKSSTASMRTPQRVIQATTHGISCSKMRSRSTSVARRPVSVQSNADVPSSSRAHLFAPPVDRNIISSGPVAQSESASEC